jgi:hypothetical protein
MAPQASEKPPIGILQSLLYWLAVLSLTPMILIWSDNAPELTGTGQHPFTKVLLSAGCLVSAVIFFGLGQVIGYLSQTAHYARLSYEQLISAQKPPTE